MANRCGEWARIPERCRIDGCEARADTNRLCSFHDALYRLLRRNKKEEEEEVRYALPLEKAKKLA